MVIVKKIEIFTDGACSGNPGNGGWGAVLRFNGIEKELSGYEVNTTNNKMELTAVIEALKALKEPCEVVLTTDSQYVMKGFTEWMPNWLVKNWKNASKKPVANQELWQELKKQSERHKIKWIWVKGHNGHPENEKCDTLARKAIESITP